MSRIYVAARYARMVEMQSVHAALIKRGHQPTSRWVDDVEEKGGMTQEAAAQMDLLDVECADALLLFTDEKSHSSAGGGRFFEAGYAHARGKIVITVGPAQIIFNHLPQLAARRHDTLESALDDVAHLVRCRDL